MENAKDPNAFRTIGELSAELGVPQHVLRYWETRFSQLRPVTRAGNRRYYRPADVALVRRIHSALSQDGYTVRGVQRLLAGQPPLSPLTSASPIEPVLDVGLVTDLYRIRTLLSDALDAGSPAEARLPDHTPDAKG